MPKNNKSNPLKSSAALTAEIGQLQRDLTKVGAAAEIIGKPALVKTEEILRALAAANEQLAIALASEAEGARQARLAGFGSISVTVSYPPGYAGNLLRATFGIEYTRLQYDQRSHAAVMQSHKATGFSGLADDAYEYLIEKAPEAIPAEIMALAPGDPRDAFRRYFLGMRQGRISVPVAVAA